MNLRGLSVLFLPLFAVAGCRNSPALSAEAAICSANRSQNGHKWAFCSREGFPKPAFGSFYRSLLEVTWAQKTLTRNEIRRSVEKAIAYALSKKEKLNAYDISTLLELDRRFSLNLDRQELLRLQAQRPPKLRTPLWRFADESYIASESDVKAMKGNDRITASALYCDKYVLPWDFYKELEAMAERDDFDATRAFLAIGLLKKRGCPFDSARLEPVFVRLRAKLCRIAAEDKAPETLRVEAMLFLAMAGYRSEIRPEWVRSILALQQKDGRFGRMVYSTLLTARMLLEYSGKQ
ncbi:MAG: hypothetical protein OHK0011_14780 [Turneriella sp.]